MKGFIAKLQARRRTEFIAIDPHACVACWKCVETCPRDVLGKVEILRHRHVRVVRAEACIGCRKCISACPHSVFSPRS